MKTFRFDTHTQLTLSKANKDWWIERDFVAPITIKACNVKEAINLFREALQKKYITISNNAIKTKKKMYRDRADGSAEQVGYVFTASTDLADDNANYFKKYLELWVEITEQVNPFAEAKV